MRATLFTLHFFLITIAFGQQNFAFKLSDSLAVSSNGQNLSNAWSGGLNYVIINKADLNFDGTEELVVFDRSARTIDVFEARGSGANLQWSFSPALSESLRLPSQMDVNWMLMRDFNCDNKKDIFYGKNSSIFVLVNQSANQELKFTPFNNGQELLTQYNSGTSRVYSVEVNLPAISDVDYDGDIDIISWDAGAQRLTLHENQSSCGLSFTSFNSCYGDIQETGNTKDVILDACGLGKKDAIEGSLHVGGSALSLDLNNDSLADLLLGNISFNNITALYNAGSRDTANFNTQDTAFPNSKPADQFEFVSAFYEDVTGDGVPDLITSSTDDTRLSVFDNTDNIWLYENTGTASAPIFAFRQNDFLQSTMIDHGSLSVPRFVDLNGDSLQDLVVAEGKHFDKPSYFSAQFKYYENTGNAAQASFNLLDTNLANITTHNLGTNIVPAFGDLDGDGDQDMLIGIVAGTLQYFDNRGSALSPDFQPKTFIFQNIDVGSYASPYLFDYDGDGDLDLFVGNRRGKVAYYENSSASSPNFTLVNANFGAIDVSDVSQTGYASPVIWSDSTGAPQLMVGSEARGVLTYPDARSFIDLPARISDTIGQGTILSQNFHETPFGISRSSGRNQFLIKASELQQTGLQQGILKSISFEVSTSSPRKVESGYNIALKQVQLDSLTTFVNDLSSVVTFNTDDLGNGWNTINFEKDFAWDGKSNLVVEVCFGPNFINNDLAVKMHSTPFSSHVYGDVKNTVNPNGCAMKALRAIKQRPNLQFSLVPAAPVGQELLAQARGLAADFSDLNGDGLPEALVGTTAGGLYYYQGKIYTPDSNVSLTEATVPQQAFTLFPNPAQSSITISTAPDLAAAYSKYRIYDLSGRPVLTGPLQGSSTEVPLHLPKGLYLVVLESHENRSTAKLLIQ